jgi:hypothetical protein
VAIDGSPRREPWERRDQQNEPRSGERIPREHFFPPFRGLAISKSHSLGSRACCPKVGARLCQSQQRSLVWRLGKFPRFLQGSNLCGSQARAPFRFWATRRHAVGYLLTLLRSYFFTVFAIYQL